MRTKPLTAGKQKQLNVFLKIYERTTCIAITKECEGDIDTAFCLFEQGAKVGCTIAMCALGRMYMSCEDMYPHDPCLGVEWFRRCVDHGPSLFARLVDPALASAQGSLGQAYYNEIGVDKDVVKAEALMRKGAEGGCAVTMNNLACLIGQERLVFDEGLMWLRKSAESGYHRGMTNLAHWLVCGKGCAPDPAEARIWLRKAMKLGDSLAAHQLAKIEVDDGAETYDVYRLRRRARTLSKRHGHSDFQSRCAECATLLRQQDMLDAAKSIEEVHRELASLAVGLFAPEALEISSGVDWNRCKELLLESLHAHRPSTSLEERAVKALAVAARSDGDCCHTLALFLESRSKTDRALPIFEQAADLGNPCAALDAARLHLHRHQPDFVKATRYLNRVATHEDTSYLARRLLDKVKQDFESMG